MAKYLLVVVTSIFSALLLAYLGGVTPFVVRAESMWPTLWDGDCILVLGWWHLPLVTGTYSYRAPQRGDVIVLRAFGLEDASPHATLVVKRIVAVGGDTLAMRDGRLELNFVHSDPAVRAAWQDSLPRASWRYEWQKALPRAGRAGAPPREPTDRNWGPFVVPTGTAFVLGDNRSSSVDSRAFGFVPVKDIVGRVTRVYLSRGLNDGRSPERHAGRSRWRWDRVGLAVN